MKRFKVKMHYVNGSNPEVIVRAKDKLDLVIMRASSKCVSDGLALYSDLYTASKCKIVEI